MTVIYQPKGKAREYCEYAINLYNGCSHGCFYCYVPAITYKDMSTFIKSKPRKNIIEQIKKEVSQYQGKEIHLCFMCDPYQHIDEQYQFTRQTIQILHDNNIIVRILTKGGKRSERDFDLLSQKPQLSKYGATLTFLDEKQSQKNEPNSALPSERLNTLQKAHKLNIPTWASLEPVLDPEQTLEIIKLSYPYIDEFKIGRWNHNKEADKINWKKFGNEAINLCKKYNKKYYIKKDLLIAL